MLTDRYMTLKNLNEVPLKCYDNQKKLIQKDIDKIDKNTKLSDLKSYNILTLKESSEINKLFKKYEKIFKKVINGEYDYIQNISFDVIRFAFSRYYNNKPYLSGMLQVLQNFMFKIGVFTLNATGKNVAAQFLDHSLIDNPEDLEIENGNVVEKIKLDKSFNNKILEIVKEYGTQNHFDTGDNKENISFNERDLFLAIHSANIRVIGNKAIDKTWNLDIIIKDRYDFTDFKELKEYAMDLIGATANNFAMIAVSSNVINEYDITIKFKLNNFEV